MTRSVTMNKKDFKELIKPIVKEVLAEMFVEIKLHEIIGESITKVLNDKMLNEAPNKFDQAEDFVDDGIAKKRQLAEYEQFLVDRKMKIIAGDKVQRKTGKEDFDLREAVLAGRKIQQAISVPSVTKSSLPRKLFKGSSIMQELYQDTVNSGFEVEVDAGSDDDLPPL